MENIDENEYDNPDNSKSSAIARSAIFVDAAWDAPVKECFKLFTPWLSAARRLRRPERGLNETGPDCLPSAIHIRIPDLQNRRSGSWPIFKRYLALATAFTFSYTSLRF